jgi:periplasmic protein TonB
MLQKPTLIKNAGAAILIFGITAIGCHSKDYNDGTATTMSSMEDTSSAMMTQGSAMDTTISSATTPVMADTSTMETTKSTTGGNMAKPNPAKKGMKGKVMIAEPSKPTGAMEPDNMGVYTNVETMASFPGGNKGLQSFFDKNIEYPQQASTDGVDGIVNVSFVVDENGKLISPSVTSPKMGYGLEDEALRVIKKMPNWTAAKLKGKNVKSRYTLPVRFELQ